MNPLFDSVQKSLSCSFADTKHQTVTIEQELGGLLEYCSDDDPQRNRCMDFLSKELRWWTMDSYELKLTAICNISSSQPSVIPFFAELIFRVIFNFQLVTDSTGIDFSTLSKLQKIQNLFGCYRAILVKGEEGRVGTDTTNTKLSFDQFDRAIAEQIKTSSQVCPTVANSHFYLLHHALETCIECQKSRSSDLLHSLMLLLFSALSLDKLLNRQDMSAMIFLNQPQTTVGSHHKIGKDRTIFLSERRSQCPSSHPPPSYSHFYSNTVYTDAQRRKRQLDKVAANAEELLFCTNGHSDEVISFWYYTTTTATTNTTNTTAATTSNTLLSFVPPLR